MLETTAKYRHLLLEAKISKKMLRKMNSGIKEPEVVEMQALVRMLDKGLKMEIRVAITTTIET